MVQARTKTRDADTLNSAFRVRAVRTYARTFVSGRLASFFQTRPKACFWGMQGGTRTRFYALRLRFYATHTDALLGYAELVTGVRKTRGTHHRASLLADTQAGYAYATQRHSVRN